MAQNDIFQEMRYHVVTLGCQMNKSDSERVSTVIEKWDIAGPKKRKKQIYWVL